MWTNCHQGVWGEKTKTTHLPVAITHPAIGWTTNVGSSQMTSVGEMAEVQSLNSRQHVLRRIGYNMIKRKSETRTFWHRKPWWPNQRAWTSYRLFFHKCDEEPLVRQMFNSHACHGYSLMLIEWLQNMLRQDGTGSCNVYWPNVTYQNLIHISRPIT